MYVFVIKDSKEKHRVITIIKLGFAMDRFFWHPQSQCDCGEVYMSEMYRQM